MYARDIGVVVALYNIIHICVYLRPDEENGKRGKRLRCLYHVPIPSPRHSAATVFTKQTGLF